jgi:hypothetical protein
VLFTHSLCFFKEELTMILDALLRLSADQQVTATANATNVVDLGGPTPKRRVTVGEPLSAVLAIGALGTTTGSLVVKIIAADTADLLTNPKTIGQIDLALADIKVGNVFVIGLSQGPSGGRYIGASYTVTGTVDGTMELFLQPLNMASVAPEHYADAISVG